MRDRAGVTLAHVLRTWEPTDRDASIRFAHARMPLFQDSLTMSGAAVVDVDAPLTMSDTRATAAPVVKIARVIAR